MTATRINLGLAEPVRLGRLTLNPAVRSIRRDDGAEEVVEPRVMQVLLALAEAKGGIVRREELTERCWEGRIVGEDAINRVMSRLRRVAEGIGADSIRIETITKIGYRLVALNHAGDAEAPEADVPPPAATATAFQAASSMQRRTTRRAVLGGAAGVGVAAIAGGGAWWALHRRRLPEAARVAMDRGVNAMRLHQADEMTTAVGAFREAARIAPGAAEPWGKLALAYRWLCFWSHDREAELNAERARDAANKALQIDPDNGDAQAALATLQPEYRNWLAYDRACRKVLMRHPDNFGINQLVMELSTNVGAIRQVAAISERLIEMDAGWSNLHAHQIMSSWALGRLDDADAAMDRVARLWPRDLSLWFIRQRILAYSGRGAASLAMIEDVDHRPQGLPAWDFDLARLEAQALMTRTPADIEAAAAAFRMRAPTSAGVAANAAQFFAAVGRLDDAFAMFDALYFDRGFSVGDVAYTEEQGTYNARRNRKTYYLWLPPMAELRADARTAEIMRGVGLIDYWRKSGTRPDFPVAGFGSG